MKLSDLKKKDILISFLLVTIPITYLYKLNSWLSIGQVVLIIIQIGHFVLSRSYKLTKQSFSIFGVFIFITFLNAFSTSINGLNFEHAINNGIVMILFAIQLMLFENEDYSFDLVYKIARLIALIIVVFLVVQLLLYNLGGGYVLTGKILPFETFDNRFVSETYGRSSSLLGEPAHVAIYLAPVYLTSLIKKDRFTLLVCLLGLLFCTSSTGLVLAIAVPGLYFLTSRDMSLAKKILLGLVLVVVIAGVLSFITTHYYFNYSRKLNREYFSNNIRLGGEIGNLKYLGIIQLFFGVGLNNWADYLSNFGVNSYNYSNAILYAVISFGIVGASFLLVLLMRGSRVFAGSKNINKWQILILVMLVLASDQVLFNQNLLYILIWLGLFGKNFSNNDFENGEVILNEIEY